MEINKKHILALKVAAIIVFAMFSFEALYSKNIITAKIPVNDLPQGTMTKKNINGHSVTVYKRTGKEMKDMGTNNQFIVFEDSRCPITIKTKGGHKYFESAKALYDNCGIKYSINGKALNHIPFTLSQDTIIVNHGYFTWL